MDAQLYIGNDQTIEVTGLIDEVSGSYLNGATVTASVKTLAGANVSGQSMPIALSYVAASNGNYRGTLEDGLVLTDGTFYVIEVSADAGSDLIALWHKQVPAQYREF